MTTIVSQDEQIKGFIEDILNKTIQALIKSDYYRRRIIGF